MKLSGIAGTEPADERHDAGRKTDGIPKSFQQVSVYAPAPAQPESRVPGAACLRLNSRERE